MAELLQTTLCYLEQNGCYLMLHRIKKKNDVNHDKWIGVGGKFDPGETAEACALREVWEETGLTMQSPAYRGIVDFTCEPWPAERMHLYTCTDFTGTLTDCNEGTLEWVPKPEVENLPIWQGDKIFLRLLAEGAPFFHLELTYHGDTLVQAVLDGETLPCGKVRAVSLLLLGAAPYVKVPCLILVSFLVVWGILTLALQSSTAPRWLRWKERISLAASVLAVLCFILSLQPYAAAFAFVFLIIKALLLAKQP